MIALTIAGSDSGGGAGIQADLKTFAAFGCYGASVVTAVTAQNTLGVHAVHTIPADIVAAQLSAVADDLPPDGCKTGMLGVRDIVDEVASVVRTREWKNLVVDPVIRATSGAVLLDDEGVDALRRLLVPLAACITPNLDEAEVLTGQTVRNAEAMAKAGQAILDLGARAVLVKGGHLDSDIVVDVLVTAQGTRRYTRSRIPGRATHGTGCTLSAAITAKLALGVRIDDAVPAAIEFVQAAMRTAPGLGAGHGPMWHDPAG